MASTGMRSSRDGETRLADESNIVSIYGGDPFSPQPNSPVSPAALESAIMDAIAAHAVGMLYPTILGVLEFCKERVKDRAYACACETKTE